MVASRLDPVCAYTKTPRPASTTAIARPKTTVSRYLIGSLAHSLITDPVTQAPHGLQRGLPEGTVDLVSQRADVDVHDPGVAVEGEVPDVLDQRAPGHDVARPAHEVLQQGELGGGELDRDLPAADRVPGRVQRQVTDGQDGGALGGRAACQRPEPGQQFRQ